MQLVSLYTLFCIVFVLLFNNSCTRNGSFFYYFSIKLRSRQGGFVAPLFYFLFPGATQVQQSQVISIFNTIRRSGLPLVLISDLMRAKLTRSLDITRADYYIITNTKKVCYPINLVDVQLSDKFRQKYVEKESNRQFLRT